MPVYGYGRVSTTRQADDGESLDVQQRTVAGYALMHGMTVDRVFVERGVSGSVPLRDRPEGAALLDILKAGDVVITPKLDRMFRSALDALDVLAKLKARGVSLHMIDLGGDVTGNGISKLVFTILSAVAEAERDRIRERVATVKADQRTRQRYLGGKVPFGFCVGSDGSLVPNLAQQAVINEAMAMRQDGKPLRAIQAAMEAQGHPLALSALHRVLEQPLEDARDAAVVARRNLNLNDPASKEAAYRATAESYEAWCVAEEAKKAAREDIGGTVRSGPRIIFE
jgi:putative DNA-invertase from lambdoid prophage Rac